MNHIRKRPPLTDGLISNAMASGFDKSNDTAPALSINHSNRAYNILNQSGQRIASFIHESKARAFAKAVQYV